jgi:hypothetical protein
MCLIVGLLLSATPASAESTPEDRAAADSLYAESEPLIQAKRFREAADKLEASLRLDPGIGTLMRLAHCYEQIGRTASSWASFHDGEAMARRAGDKRADEAAQQAKRLEPLLSRLVLDVAAENQAGGVEVRRDGKVVDPAAYRSPIPLDPGPHTLEAAGPGRQPWKTTITIDAKPGTQTVQVPALAAAGTTGAAQSTADVRPSESRRNVAPAVVLGVLAAGAVGTGIGLMTAAGSKYADADAVVKMIEAVYGTCVSRWASFNPKLCGDLQDKYKAGNTFHNVAVGTFIGGGAAAAGTALYLLWPSPGAKPTGQGFAHDIRLTPILGSTTSGLLVSGSF